MVQLDMRMENGRISLDPSSFEHVLNCLANQMFIGKVPPYGDPMLMDPKDYKNVHEGNQAAIDDCWRQGMDFLGNIGGK